MELMAAIRSAIAYAEEHLEEPVAVTELAKQVGISPFFLQKSFSVLTGISLSEYIRNRRLTRAAEALTETDDTVLDIALRYGYDTPEGFTKAFSRFHGATPSRVRSGEAQPRRFLPLSVQIQLQGGYRMEPNITNLFSFKVIGFPRDFSFDAPANAIPDFWTEICEKYAASVYAGNEPANPYEKALMDNCIGEYGVCIHSGSGERFRYLIAGKYAGGEVPEGMEVYEFPRGEWAIFDCRGPVPESIRSMSRRIFGEWLPGHPEYELSGDATLEWYDCLNGEMSDPDYHTAVWLPVKRK